MKEIFKGISSLNYLCHSENLENFLRRMSIKFSSYSESINVDLLTNQMDRP